MYLRWEGDPYYYVRHDEGATCKQAWVECYDAAGIVPNPGFDCGPLPGSCKPIKIQTGQLECNLERQQCFEWVLSGKKVIDEIKSILLVDPRQIEEGNIDPWVNPPVFDYQQRMQTLGDDLASGAISQAGYDTQIESLMSHPESIWSSFQQERQGFVSVFGTEGFESIVGPEIHAVEAVDPQSLDLTPAGVVALSVREALAAVATLFQPLFLMERIAEFEASYSEDQFDAWAEFMNGASALEAAVELEAGP